MVHSQLRSTTMDLAGLWKRMQSKQYRFLLCLEASSPEGGDDEAGSMVREATSA